MNALAGEAGHADGPMDGQTGCHECHVCGATSLDLDEVEHAGTLLLAECRRCRHRWTLPVAGTLPEARPGMQPARLRVDVGGGMGEAASAA